MHETETLIKPLSLPDIESLVELTKTTYPDKEISKEEYLEWEYHLNPDGHALISTAANNSEVVSQYIIIPRKYSINNSLWNGSLSVNTLTHPNYRGNNYFPKLASQAFKQCASRNIHFTIGFPNPRSSPIIRKKNLFSSIGNLSLLVKPLTPFRSIVKYFSGDKNKSGNEIELKIPITNGKEISTLNLNLDKPAYEKFLAAFNKEKQNVTFRSPDFISWRYEDIPFRKYSIFKLTENGDVAAIAVFRAKYIYGLRCGIMVDYCALNRVSRSNELLNFVNSLASLNNLDLIISAVTSNSKEYSSIIRNGFYKCPSFLLPQKLTFIVRRHATDCPDQVEDFSKWFLTFGDYDIF